MESILPTHDAHPYFPLTDLGKEVRTIHGRIQHIGMVHGQRHTLSLKYSRNRQVGA